MPVDPIKARQYLDTITASAAGLRAMLDDPGPPATNIITVKQGDNLQQALDSASGGDTIRVAPGTYKGNFVLNTRPVPTGAFPAFPGITVRPDVDDGNLRLTSTPWITKDYAPALVRLVSGDGLTEVLRTAPKATPFMFLGLDLPPLDPSRTMVSLGTDKASGQISFDQMPGGFVFDRCYFHGDPTPGKGQHRGIAANCGGLVVKACYFGDFFEVGRDSQAIAGWNGAGPFLITDSFLEASGENVLFGGSGPGIPNLVPTGITLQHCKITKNPEWRNHPTPPSVKNLFEIKNGMTVLVENNLFENCWLSSSGQYGHALVFKAANSDVFDTWSICQDVIVRYNRLRNVGGVLNIHNSEGQGPTQGTHRITVQHNLATDINEAFLGDGRVVLIGSGPEAVAIDHNTLLAAKGKGSFLTLYDQGDVIKGGKVTNNIVREGQYGLFGGGSLAMGQTAFTDYFPGGMFKGNAIEQGGARSIEYGPDNAKIGAGQLDAMLDATKKPNAGSLLAGVVTTDHLTVGADVAQITSRTQGL